jgi:hypothetical protein
MVFSDCIEIVSFIIFIVFQAIAETVKNFWVQIQTFVHNSAIICFYTRALLGVSLRYVCVGFAP